MTREDEALVALLRRLDARGYEFTAITPARHLRVIARAEKAEARDLRDVFGWSLPFAADLLPGDLLALLREADALVADGKRLRIRWRVARLGGTLFLHSAYPTEAADSVFFGPDSYRFARFLAAELRAGAPAARLVDMGAGCGAGALSAAALLPGARLTLIDTNPEALRLARINAAAAGLVIETACGDSLDAAPGAFDLFIANPPFLMDGEKRTYRDGGDMLGARLSLDWALAAARQLPPGGRALLYTGSAIADGRDGLRAALAEALPPLGCSLRYEELDPDVFGEELSEPAYREVERIAIVGAAIERRGP